VGLVPQLIGDLHGFTPKKDGHLSPENGDE
jgi:hypothetical protein